MTDETIETRVAASLDNAALADRLRRTSRDARAIGFTATEREAFMLEAARRLDHPLTVTHREMTS